ncbi:DEAD/DEAH box helicase [candidate division KSB1 bacterium]|nr:DEAD/DEAH box helicase [Candidatus Aminicenantes bacterium]RQW03555.1 MAG: DEAD/DEAH box helicase [candidate division KSB1 bacterium]
MLETVFSPDFFTALGSPSQRIKIATVDSAALELAVTGIFAHFRESVVWLGGENESFAVRKEKVEQWLKLFALDDVPVHIYRLPFEDPYINPSPDPARIAAKQRLLVDLRAGRKMIVLATLAALSLRIEKQSSTAVMDLAIQNNDILERNELIHDIVGLGYQRRDVVEINGDIAWRGNVVDVFPVNSNHPVRLEFEGRRVVSLRSFDLDSQRSLAALARIVIVPNCYFPGQADAEIPFLLPAANSFFLTEALSPCRLLAQNFDKIEHEYHKLLENYRRIRLAVVERKHTAIEVETIFSFPYAEEKIVNFVDFPERTGMDMDIRVWGKSLLTLDGADMAHLQRLSAQGFRLLAYAADSRLLENVQALLPGLESHFFNIPCSFENPRQKTIFLTGRVYQPNQGAIKVRARAPEQWQREMAVGDLVVHRRHGIGKFAGFKRLNFEGQGFEFLKIEYLNREFLYVPWHELDVLKPYSGSEESLPAMDRLGGKTWRQKTERAKKSIIHYTRDLLDLYAMRKALRKPALLPVADIEEKLQHDFSFVETEDQKKAIRAVLDDLAADFPMDRLICGDVSFGKTEVALRAALRTVANGKQVAFLCPTTILALQHFRNFQHRLADFPLRLAMLSRLVDAKEKKRIITGLERGTIDLVVGTHALLAKGIAFKNLGLFIVDEEQRFGVFQKEKLKKGREHIDVLTLSATPIPRTLSMALSGLQDISIINTPPLGRLAIKNFVGYFSRDVVVSAVLNEIERDGAVFVVFNDIERIFAFRDQLAAWLPDVAMVVIHARMATTQIEKSLMDFIAGKYRLLLSTTIIENGIDIPRVNTLLVMNADRLGLTQMYQLRGRIGRSSRQAYAYFLVDSRQPIMSEKAKKRLDAIREFSELGSGYKLAEFDLSLRGAGALLGNRQHGHVEALGYDYFLELLQQTIREFKGEGLAEPELQMRVHFSYAIAESYLTDTAERIRVYRRILEALQPDELVQLRAELGDRFGQIPESVEKIFYVGAVKLFARRLGWLKVEIFGDRVQVESGRELQLKSGADHAIPGLEVVDQKHWELQYTSLEGFCQLGCKLERLLL